MTFCSGVSGTLIPRADDAALTVSDSLSCAASSERRRSIRERTSSRSRSSSASRTSAAAICVEIDFRDLNGSASYVARQPHQQLATHQSWRLPTRLTEVLQPRLDLRPRCCLRLREPDFFSPRTRVTGALIPSMADDVTTELTTMRSRMIGSRRYRLETLNFEPRNSPSRRSYWL